MMNPLSEFARRLVGRNPNGPWFIEQNMLMVDLEPWLPG
jgi:hypothetical protein